MWMTQTKYIRYRGVAQSLAALHLVDYEKAIVDGGYNKEVYKDSPTDKGLHMVQMILSAVPEKYDDQDKEKM